MKKINVFIICTIITLMVSVNTFGMHIAEGFLPKEWCIGWDIVALPFMIYGYISIKKTVENNPKIKLILAMAGAFIFVLSALKIPSFNGSCSHPTGIGLGAILFGPGVTCLLGLIVLIFQALLLAHGGISTLGANVFSMAIVGSFTAWGVYKISRKLNISTEISIFLGAFLGDLLTYVVTSIQLAVCYPSEVGGIFASFIKFAGVFAVTQLPLAISEGILTVVIFRGISKYFGEEISYLGFINENKGARIWKRT